MTFTVYSSGLRETSTTVVLKALGAHPETRSTRRLMKERAGSLQTLAVGIFLRRIHFSLDRLFATHLLKSAEMS